MAAKLKIGKTGDEISIVNLESGPPKDHFNSNFRAKDLDVICIS
jgi:hypothetical protein